MKSSSLRLSIYQEKETIEKEAMASKERTVTTIVKEGGIMIREMMIVRITESLVKRKAEEANLNEKIVDMKNTMSRRKIKPKIIKKMKRKAMTRRNLRENIQREKTQRTLFGLLRIHPNQKVSKMDLPVMVNPKIKLKLISNVFAV